MTATGVACGEGGAGGEERRADQRIDHQDGAKAEALAEWSPPPIFMPMAPTAVAKVIMPGLERRHAEADLQHQRQQERQRADAEPEHEAAEHAGAECRQPEQREIERRDWRCAARAPDRPR